MKKCPTCGKEFEDSMKFCQVDGTELVADEPAFDPYATVVGHKFDAAELAKPTAGEVVIPPIEETTTDVAEEPRIHETTGSISIVPPDKILELPGVDPLKTMYVSEAELKEAFRSGEANETLTEESMKTVPPAAGSGEMAPPPSPFSTPEAPFQQPSNPSSYADGDAETILAQDAMPQFKEADTVRWTPPPVDDNAWQNQQVAANTPFQPVQAGVDGQSKVLAIASLACGILSLLCCLPILTGPAAVIVGFIAKKKAVESPSEFGGSGLALAGMITGGIGILIGIVQLIWVIFGGGLNFLTR